jgi:hypothetical protein
VFPRLHLIRSPPPTSQSTSQIMVLSCITFSWYLLQVDSGSSPALCHTNDEAPFYFCQAFCTFEGRGATASIGPAASAGIQLSCIQRLMRWRAASHRKKYLSLMWIESNSEFISTEQNNLGSPNWIHVLMVFRVD